MEIWKQASVLLAKGDCWTPLRTYFPSSFHHHNRKNRGVSVTGNEGLTNPFATLLVFQESQRPELAAPSVWHLAMMPHLRKFSGSVCFPEDSLSGKRVSVSEVAFCEGVCGQALEEKEMTYQYLPFLEMCCTSCIYLHPCLEVFIISAFNSLKGGFFFQHVEYIQYISTNMYGCMDFT